MKGGRDYVAAIARLGAFGVQRNLWHYWNSTRGGMFNKTIADVAANTGAFKGGTYVNARVRTRRKRKNRSRRAVIARKRNRMFKKKVRRVLKASADKKYTANVPYLETSAVRTAAKDQENHLTNHRMIVYKFLGPNIQGANGVAAATGSALTFPARGDGSNQFDGRGYQMKGFLCRWYLHVPQEDARVSFRLRLMQSKFQTAYGTDENNVNDPVDNMWERGAFFGPSSSTTSVNETVGKLNDGWRVLGQWDLHDSELYSRVDTNDMARTGKFFVPYKRKVTDALENMVSITCYNRTVTVPSAVSGLSRWYWVLIPHVQGRATGVPGTNSQLQDDTVFKMNIETHYCDI